MSSAASASKVKGVAWLDAARVVAAFAVVLLHTSSSVVSGAATGSPAWWAGNLYDSGTRWCVPVFVMISGALLLDHRRRENPVTFYRRRSARILAPLVFWATVFTLWKAYLAHAEGSAFSWPHALDDAVQGKPYYHLWFLYMLACLYVVTPLIRAMVRRSSRAMLIVVVSALFALFAAAQIAGLTVRAEHLWPLWFLPFIAYFVTGHLIMTSTHDGGRTIAAVVFVLAAAATAVAYFVGARTQDIRENTVVHDYLGVTVIPMAIATMWLLKGVRVDAAQARRLASLAALTLGVYVMHPMFVDLIRMHWPLVSRLPLLSIPVVAALIALCSLALTAIVQRIPVLRVVV